MKIELTNKEVLLLLQILMDTDKDGRVIFESYRKDAENLYSRIEKQFKESYEKHGGE